MTQEPNYAQWRARHPQAAAELEGMLAPGPVAASAVGKSEAWAQQQDRLRIAHAGGMAWRNNVGATPAKCPKCKEPQQPIRYGLCNDSHKLNKKIKSSDLIGCMPVLITPAHVGTIIGRFTSIESKHPGWRFHPNDKHEQAQASWLAIICRLGGYATFSTGEAPL